MSELKFSYNKETKVFEARLKMPNRTEIATACTINVSDDEFEDLRNEVEEEMERAIYKKLLGVLNSDK